MVAAVVGCLVVLFLAAGVLRIGEDSMSRVASEHNIVLPPSATQIQAMGDASGPLRWVGLDRGASSVFVIDNTELPDLLGEFVWTEENTSFGTFPIPANSVYQPKSTPWPADTEPDAYYRTVTPPSSADFAVLLVYPLDDGQSGIWLYSDWN